MTADATLDDLAAAAHDAWYAEKARRLAALGLATWPSETGEEQLVPWAALSESVREFDRIVVRAIQARLLVQDPAESPEEYMSREGWQHVGSASDNA